jgi:hypothetical protein
METTATRSGRNNMEKAIETAAQPTAVTQPTKTKKPAKSAKPSKKAKAVKRAKPAAKKNAKPVAERSNKKTEVIALLKRPQGALREIMEATRWQPHTVRGFVSILGKNGDKIESSKNDAGERTYKIAK